MPRELVRDDRYPPYFSGAGYLMTRNVAFKLATAKDQLQITPLDDTYIGTLIKHINMTSKMISSVSLCTGVHVVPTNAGGWSMAADNDDPCFLAGLTMYHRFGDAGNNIKFSTNQRLDKIPKISAKSEQVKGSFTNPRMFNTVCYSMHAICKFMSYIDNINDYN
jgi:hypothetical protein